MQENTIDCDMAHARERGVIMNKVKFDYSRNIRCDQQREVCYMQKLTEDAKKVLLERTGGGNDYLGWDRSACRL